VYSTFNKNAAIANVHANTQISSFLLLAFAGVSFLALAALALTLPLFYRSMMHNTLFFLGGGGDGKRHTRATPFPQISAAGAADREKRRAAKQPFTTLVFPAARTRRIMSGGKTHKRPKERKAIWTLRSRPK
jgi:hypothetical protein